MNDIGETLRDARESSGVSLNEVSKDLDIKVEILQNIEEGKSGAFKDIFELKSLISNYAKYLGLDAEKLVDEELVTVNMNLGKTNVEGEGIEVILRETENEEISPINADDLLVIVNALKLAGAEAISINA